MLIPTLRQVIEGTFVSMIRSDDLPQQLVSDLLHRFSSSEGYELFPDVRNFFDRIRKLKSETPSWSWNEVIVGVISNSDDRVPTILTSLGLSVSTQRFVAPGPQRQTGPTEFSDIDFVIHSYDIGAEKPDRRVFDAAKTVADLVSRRSTVDTCYVHIGDDFEKDYLAAEKAGWKPLLLGGHGRAVSHTNAPDVVYAADLANSIKLLERPPD